MGQKFKKAHWTIYTIILKDIEGFPRPFNYQLTQLLNF
jgi:hypothetical protein